MTVQARKGQLTLATFVLAGVAWSAAADGPLSPEEGAFVDRDAGLEILDTGLRVEETELSIAALYQSCQRTAKMPQKKRKLRKLAKKGRLVTADDIPVAHTPECGYEHFPPPILTECNEPLAEGAADLRGLWVTVEGSTVGHAERIEQCGDRVIITGGGVIHDMRADGTLENGMNDVSALNCQSISVTAQFVEGRLELEPFDLAVAVVRELDGEELVWNFLGEANRLVKICGPSH